MSTLFNCNQFKYWNFSFIIYNLVDNYLSKQLKIRFIVSEDFEDIEAARIFFVLKGFVR